MLGMLSSQLAFSAATTLAKKTFEFSITSSLKGLSDVIRERFSHSQVLQDTQAELEAKVKMLCLPVDLLAHFATQGNTALQEPLGVALGVLEEVEAFRQALVQHDVTRAQDGSSPEAATASAAQLCKRLRELISRLDSLLPYLNLAISTAVLLSQGSPSPVSYSRLMAASWHLRASPKPGAAVFSLAEASWHEERRLTSAGPAMGEAFRRCRLTVCRCGAAAAAREGAPASPFQGSAGESAGSFGYELLVEQDLDDGLYHEPSEQAAALRVQVADIVGLDWETTQSLGQGENEYRPALVLHMWQSSSAAAAGADTPASAAAAGEQAEGGGLHTPPESLPRPTSRAGSRRGGTAAAEPSAAAGAGSVTPQQALEGGSPGGVGGTLRRCAITLIPRPVIDTASGSEDGGEDAGDVAHDAAADDSDDSAGGGDRPLGLLAGPGGLHTGGAAALQREWQLLGELEFVLRLCILEWREQAPHQSVTDERIALHFQATSAPASSHAHRGAAARTTAPPRTAGAYDSALLRRSGTAAQRWRNAAAGTAHAISEGIEALTHGVRQLSFTPGGSKPGSGPAAPAPASEEAAVEPASGEAGSAGSRRQTRRSSRTGGRGFGSPVQ